MKKYLFLAMILFVNVQCCFCATDAVGAELKESLKVHSNEPNIMNIAFALIFVICLIYITGLIYSKLNIIGAKTVKDQLKDHDLSTAFVLSTTQLGQNKSLHIIDVLNKKLLIGVTPNSINLIKDLTEEEVKKEEEILTKEGEIVREDFDLHKKYL